MTMDEDRRSGALCVHFRLCSNCCVPSRTLPDIREALPDCLCEAFDEATVELSFTTWLQVVHLSASIQAAETIYR